MEIKIDKYSGRPMTLRDEMRELECASKKVTRMGHSPVRGYRYSRGRVSGSSVPIYSETCLSDFLDNLAQAEDFAGNFVARDMSEAVDRNDLYSD